MKHEIIARDAQTTRVPQIARPADAFHQPYVTEPQSDRSLPSKMDAHRARFAAYQDGAKRRFDVLGCLMLAPFIAPVVGLLWCLVRLDGGAGFFGHWRVGKDGVPFRCWKLRSMCVDAEARLARHLAQNPEAALEWEANYKLAHDPRVTRLGRFLRKTSLDELPQLWNVWRGEMSLVGPRPVPAAELAEYMNNVWAYLAARPGITGLWQVSGRNRVSYSTRVGMDLRYVLEAGVRTDLWVLWKTLGEVLRRSGV